MTTMIESGEFCVGYKSQTVVPVMDDQDAEIAEWVLEIEEDMGLSREVFLRKIYKGCQSDGQPGLSATRGLPKTALRMLVKVALSILDRVTRSKETYFSFVA